jgi:hypothetical protein
MFLDVIILVVPSDLAAHFTVGRCIASICTRLEVFQLHHPGGLGSIPASEGSRFKGNGHQHGQKPQGLVQEGSKIKFSFRL